MIYLNTANEAGYRLTYSFFTTTEEAYNSMLGKWRQQIAAAHEGAVREAAALDADRTNIDSLGQELATQVRNIKNTGIPSDLIDMASAIKDQKIAVQQIKKDLMALKRDASVVPMTCYQAYQTLAYDYNQTLGYSVSTFRRAKDSLEKRLANAPSVIEKTTKATTELPSVFRLPTDGFHATRFS